MVVFDVVGEVGVPQRLPAARNIYGDVRAVLSAVVDDGLLPRNPCSAKSVRPPAAEQRRVVPWLPVQVHAVRAALPQRYGTMLDVGAGCGLRQGEIAGLAEDALDFDGGVIRVVRQVKLIRGKAVFKPAGSSPAANGDDALLGVTVAPVADLHRSPGWLIRRAEGRHACRSGPSGHPLGPAPQRRLPC